MRIYVTFIAYGNNNAILYIKFLTTSLFNVEPLARSGMIVERWERQRMTMYNVGWEVWEANTSTK